MIEIIIPTNKFPTLAQDGTKTYAGILQSYFTKKDIMGRNVGISRDWDDKYAAQISRDYIRRILPIITQLFGEQKPMHEYREEDFEAVLDELNRVHHYADSSMQRYRRNLWSVYKMGVLQQEYPDNIKWDIQEADEKDQEQNRAHTLTKLRKSFSIQEDLRMLQWFCSLDPKTASGEEIGLALMYFLGVRDNEACGASYGDFRLMKDHPDMAIFIMGNTTSLRSNLLKPGGKTSNAPRQLPVFLYLYQFIEARRTMVQSEIDAGRISFSQNIETLDKLPVVCKGNDYFRRAETRDLSIAGHPLFSKVGIGESELKWLWDTLMSEDFKDNIIEEKNPTPYLLRRNTVTRLYHLGFEWETIQYWIAHDIESVQLKRNFFSDEETLYELGKAYECHPIFMILAEMLGSTSICVNSIPTNADRYKLQAGRTTVIDIEAREPNTPVFVTAKSGKPFSVVQTTREATDIPDSLASIDHLLRNAYWEAYWAINKE